MIESSTSEKRLPDDLKEVTISRALLCRGCREWTFRSDTWLGVSVSEILPTDGPNYIHFEPARLWRRPPNWLTDIEKQDVDLRGLLDEVYSACNDKQIRLLSMGVRAVLDHVMTLILEGDAGSFEQKLDIMVDDGHLAQNRRNDIGVVIDAGSASSHRGFKPPHQLLEQMVAVMENIVYEHYIAGPMLKTAKRLIPPRPPRQI